jgi:hypothetical protein
MRDWLYDDLDSCGDWLLVVSIGVYGIWYYLWVLGINCGFGINSGYIGHI